MTSNETAFVLGFMHGLKRKKGTIAPTYRQAESRFPHMPLEDVRCYVNGFEDGSARDSFRYNLIRGKESRQSKIGESAAAKTAQYSVEWGGTYQKGIGSQTFASLEAVRGMLGHDTDMKSDDIDELVAEGFSGGDCAWIRVTEVQP